MQFIEYSYTSCLDTTNLYILYMGCIHSPAQPVKQYIRFSTTHTVNIDCVYLNHKELFN